MAVSIPRLSQWTIFSGKWKVFWLTLLLVPYLLYLIFVVMKGRGPIDYETFMDIGNRFLQGVEVYGENSYYPLPYVMIFAFFAALPRPLSQILWHLLPVIASLLISGWNPLILLYAPLFSHFTGGQTALFGLLGLWGYRRAPDPAQVKGGVWLALTFLKPQLAIFPFGYALWTWWKEWQSSRKIPHQAWAWLIAFLAIYLPSFLVIPDWPLRWLENPRPLAERAMSGFLPRTLLYFISWKTIFYWLVWGILAGMLFWLIWHLNGKCISLDLLVLWGFVISPLVHDYDLIQLIPLLEPPILLLSALLASIPGWLTIILAYEVDKAWYTFTFIAPIILAGWLLYQNKFLRLRKNSSHGEAVR